MVRFLSGGLVDGALLCEAFQFVGEAFRMRHDCVGKFGKAVDGGVGVVQPVFIGQRGVVIGRAEAEVQPGAFAQQFFGLLHGFAVVEAVEKLTAFEFHVVVAGKRKMAGDGGGDFFYEEIPGKITSLFSCVGVERHAFSRAGKCFAHFLRQLLGKLDGFYAEEVQLLNEFFVCLRDCGGHDGVLLWVG